MTDLQVILGTQYYKGGTSLFKSNSAQKIKKINPKNVDLN